MNLFELPQTEKEAIKLLQDSGILPTKRDFMDTYLAEFMVRKWWKLDDPFASLMSLLAEVFPPAED